MSDKTINAGSLIDDARAIELVNSFIRICEKEKAPQLALLLEQLINTISEIGIRNIRPHRPIDPAQVRSIEQDRAYFISTVHMNGHGVKEDWFETAVFVSDEDGEITCWNPVWHESTTTLDEAKTLRKKVEMMARSGSFDKIDPWET